MSRYYELRRINISVPIPFSKGVSATTVILLSKYGHHDNWEDKIKGVKWLPSKRKKNIETSFSEDKKFMLIYEYK